jgi:hypothetical protein
VQLFSRSARAVAPGELASSLFARRTDEIADAFAKAPRSSFLRSPAGATTDARRAVLPILLTRSCSPSSARRARRRELPLRRSPSSLQIRSTRLRTSPRSAHGVFDCSLRSRGSRFGSRCLLSRSQTKTCPSRPAARSWARGAAVVVVPRETPPLDSYPILVGRFAHQSSNRQHAAPTLAEHSAVRACGGGG